MLNSQRTSWVVTSAAFVANFVNFGVLFSFGIFLTPIAETFDTSTGPVAPLFSAAVCFYYLAGAVGGRFSDSVGVKPVVASGAALMTIGLVVSSLATELWHLYLVYAPLVGSAVGCCYPPMIGTVGRWFKERRASAISLVLAGVGMGTFVVPIVCNNSMNCRSSSCKNRSMTRTGISRDISKLTITEEVPFTN